MVARTVSEATWSEISALLFLVCLKAPVLTPLYLLPLNNIISKQQQCCNTDASEVSIIALHGTVAMVAQCTDLSSSLHSQDLF